MTTNLIALAKQAGAICTPVHFSRCIAEFDNQSLQAFADLIRKDEREACALIAQKTVCDTHIPTGVKIYGAYAAKAIRARATK